MSDLARRQEYAARLNRVCDYIEANLDREFTLAELARVASFSKFHFHRLFHAFSGETLFQFIQRLRLERAAYLLSNDLEKPITEVALDCGFSGPAAFTRSFRSRFRLSPSAYRKRGQTKSKQRQAIGNSGKAPPSASVHIEYKSRLTRFQLGQDEFQQAWDWVYGQWLPQSGYLPDDRPCFELYPEPRLPDGTFVVDIYAPVKPL